MEGLIRDLLDQLGAVLEQPSSHVPCPGITLLGILTTPPATRSGPHLNSGTHVWHAHDGWAPLDSLEIERWLVDAPDGAHWLLSERKLRLDRKPHRNGITYEVWGPERFSQWLGEAVLNGDLNASTPANLPASIQTPSLETEDVERSTPTPPKSGVCSLRPRVELSATLEKIALTNAESRPVLLCARIWSITGILRGPEEAAERQWWKLLEDPFSGEIDHLGDAEELDFIPSLERIEPNHWLELTEIAPRLATYCEERRHYTVTESSGASQVQGSVLHWWKLDPSSAEMTPRLALIPAWQIRIPERGWALVHGLTGQVLPLPN
ncbi:MAG: hypothetical protein VX627_00505 [Candidatus Thermoplasmatota archaeon]|nr:hypothetical protein [Candidatus Thermoplasmatota archaeon]